MKKRRDRPRQRRTRLIASAVWFGAAALPIAILVAFALGQVIEIAGRWSVGPNTVATVSPQSFAFSFYDWPRAVPEIRFVDREGRGLTLADFHNRPVLLNIWATWCVPCRQEMPSLARLQAKFGASQLNVLPLSIDRQGLLVVKEFYAELGLGPLGIYLDPSSEAANKLNAAGIPTTLLIDRNGQEVGRKVGPAEWDSPEVVALIREHLGVTAREMQVHP